MEEENNHKMDHPPAVKRSSSRLQKLQQEQLKKKQIQHVLLEKRRDNELKQVEESAEAVRGSSVVTKIKKTRNNIVTPQKRQSRHQKEGPTIKKRSRSNIKKMNPMITQQFKIVLMEVKIVVPS